MGQRNAIVFRAATKEQIARRPVYEIPVYTSAIQADAFPFRGDFTLSATIDLERLHGQNLEDELVRYLASEIKFSIDELVTEGFMLA